MVSSSSSSFSSYQSGVCVPVYELAPPSNLKAVEHASSLEDTCTDDAGEYYSMAMAESVAAGQVPDGAVIVLPLSEPTEDQRLDFTFLASSPLVFLRVYSKPQPRMTYCRVSHEEEEYPGGGPAPSIYVMYPHKPYTGPNSFPG